MGLLEDIGCAKVEITHGDKNLSPCVFMQPKKLSIF